MIRCKTHRKIQFRTKAGSYGLGLPGITVEIGDWFLTLALHGFHAVRYSPDRKVVSFGRAVSVKQLPLHWLS